MLRTKLLTPGPNLGETWAGVDAVLLLLGLEKLLFGRELHSRPPLARSRLDHPCSPAAAAVFAWAAAPSRCRKLEGALERLTGRSRPGCAGVPPVCCAECV